MPLDREVVGSIPDAFPNSSELLEWTQPRGNKVLLRNTIGAQTLVQGMPKF